MSVVSVPFHLRPLLREHYHYSVGHTESGEKMPPGQNASWKKCLLERMPPGYFVTRKKCLVRKKSYFNL